MSEVTERVERRVELKVAFARGEIEYTEADAGLEATGCGPQERFGILADASDAQPILSARPQSDHEAVQVLVQAINHCKTYGGTWILNEALRITSEFAPSPESEDPCP